MTIILMLCILALAVAILLVHWDQNGLDKYVIQNVTDCNTNFTNLEQWLRSHNRKLKALRLHLKLPVGYESSELTDGTKNGMKYIDGPNGWIAINPDKIKKSKKK